MASVGAVCKGKVEWFNPDKGFGFISYAEGNSKDIFVHYSAILASGFKTLSEGMEVEFTVSEGSGGRLQASQVTVIGAQQRTQANERKYYKNKNRQG